MLKLLGKLIKYSIGLFLVLTFGALAFMIYDEDQLGKAVNSVAQEMMNSGTPYVIPLPADRHTLATYQSRSADRQCAQIISRNGQVTHVRINGVERVGEIRFENGVDLSRYANDLAVCEVATILLMAKGGFLKGSFELTYENGRVTGITQPRLWD